MKKQYVLVTIVLFLVMMTTSTMVFAASSLQLGESLGQDGPTATPALPDPFTQEDLQLLSGNVLRPNGMFWHEGFLYVGCNGDFTIYRVNDTTGETITYISGVENINALYVEEGPVIWVPDYSRNTLTVIDREQPLAQQRLDVLDGLGSPWGLAPLANGDFLVTQFRTEEVLQVSREGDSSVVVEGLDLPTGITTDGNYVYVANHDSARRSIEWYELSAMEDGVLNEDDMQSLVKGALYTTNLVMGPDNMLYFAYALGQRGVVGRVDPAVCREQGGCSNIDIEPVIWTELQAPLVGLNITPDMRLFIHSQYGAEIYWVQLPTDDSAQAQAE